MTDRKSCSRCGAGVDQDARFCENCGATLTSPEAVTRVASETRAAIGRATDSWKDQRPGFRLLLTVGLVLVVAAIATESLGASWKTGVFAPVEAAQGKTVLSKLALVKTADECAQGRSDIYTALDAYRADNPDAAEVRRVSELTPKYLADAPRCPSGGRYKLDGDEMGVECTKHTPLEESMDF